jgi:hypothetical protein
LEECGENYTAYPRAKEIWEKAWQKPFFMLYYNQR